MLDLSSLWRRREGQHVPTELPCHGHCRTWTSFTMAQGLWEVVRGQHPAQGSPYPPWVGVTADILPPCVRGSRPEEPRKGFLPGPLVTLRLGGFLLPLWTHFFQSAKWTYSRRCSPKSALTIIKAAAGIYQVPDVCQAFAGHWNHR